MPEEVLEGAPAHPYYDYDTENRERIDNNKVYSEHFWAYISHPEEEFSDEFLFPNPPEFAPQSELTPEKVVQEFNQYKSGLLQIRQSDDRLKLPNVGKSLDDFSLYDVYLWGFWDTNQNAYSNTPAGEIATSQIARNAEDATVPKSSPVPTWYYPVRYALKGQNGVVDQRAGLERRYCCMTVSSYKVRRLLARRRQLEYDLFQLNREMEDLELDPYPNYGRRRDIGLPYNMLEASIRWILSVGIEQPMERLVDKTLLWLRAWLSKRRKSRM